MANYGVNINFKVIGQSKLDRALKKTEQLDKKINLLNKKGINIAKEHDYYPNLISSVE